MMASFRESGSGDSVEEKAANTLINSPEPFMPTTSTLSQNTYMVDTSSSVSRQELGTGSLHCSEMLALSPSLKDLCLKVLCDNLEYIVSLEGLPDDIKHGIASLLCHSRKFSSHFLKLYTEGSPIEIYLSDCSWMIEEQFKEVFSQCNIDCLKELQLDFCRFCSPIYILCRAPNCLSSLNKLSLKGSDHLLDGGLDTIVASAPFLKSLNLSQCRLISTKGIISVAEKLKNVLQELYIDDCIMVNVILILPALNKLQCLEVLSVALLETMTDDILKSLLTVSGPNMRKLIIAGCRNLTNASLKIIGEYCPRLSFLDIQNLNRLNDSSIIDLANSGCSFQTLKICHSAFSDEALAVFIEASGSTLQELVLNNIEKAAGNTALAISRRCFSLRSLDLSFCRKMTDMALGAIVDSCSNLRARYQFFLEWSLKFSCKDNWFEEKGVKAVILVDDFDFCPLTFHHPKPLVDFANKPIILYQIEALKEVGVTEFVIATNYMPKVILDFLKEFEAKLSIRIKFSLEIRPLGCVVLQNLAKDKILNGSFEPFFVLNSDVISEYPFAELAEFHKCHGGEATVMVAKVDEPSKYDVVVMEEETGRVERFVEKPEIFVGNKINAGIYLMNPSVLDEIEIKPGSIKELFSSDLYFMPTSMEKKFFSKLISDKKLYAMVLSGFWMEIRRLNDYLTGLSLYLNYIRNKSPYKLAFGPHVIGNVLVDESASIGEGCSIGPDVAIGPGSVVESNVRLSRCTLMRGARVKINACILSSIIGRHSTVGQWARVDNMTLGEGVHIDDEVVIIGGVVFPSQVNHIQHLEIFL